LNSTVMVVVPLVVLPAIGMGNSPPARKLAVWPLSAVRFGSASVVISPSWASALSVA
jgi:hypothetical protein